MSVEYLIDLCMLTVIVLLIGMMIRFYFTNRQLSQSCQVLEENIGRIKNDLAGLCASAVAVDRKLYINDDRLRDMYSRIDNFEQSDQETHPYQFAINLAKSGGSSAQLVDQCGFSHGEAELMVRLYGFEASRANDNVVL